MTDPEEFYDDATASFPSKADLAPDDKPFGPGRLVAIWAKKNGTRNNDEGKAYGFTDTLTLVLDDGPDGHTMVTELVASAVEKPIRVDMQHSTSGIHSRLKGRVDGKNKNGVPLKWRPMIGRVNTRASAKNDKVPAYSISEPTEADREIIERHKALIISINEEMEAAEDSAAFE